MTIFGVANFGRPQLQYDTFDLSKLPSGSVIETATAPQIKKTPSQAVESESSPRSADNSAVAGATPFGVKIGGLAGAQIGRESKMGKLQYFRTVGGRSKVEGSGRTKVEKVRVGKVAGNFVFDRLCGFSSPLLIARRKDRDFGCDPDSGTAQRGGGRPRRGGA